MDPEHDVPAAAGVQLHDGLADVGAGAGGEEGSWARALLRRGWDLSTKAAIAGVAAAAAPVVAPPALILSAVGVVLSVPFAAYLASLAATDRLMRALLPPPARATKPCRAGDREDGGWEPEIPDADAEAPPFDYRSKTEEVAVEKEEEHDGVPLLPRSLEPLVPEEPLAMSRSGDKEDGMADGEFAGQESGHDYSSVANIGEQEDHIEMVEALPQGTEFSGLAAPVLHNDDNVVQRMGEATFRAQQQSAQELPASANGDKTPDGRCKTIEEDESSKRILSPGTIFSGVPVPMSGDEDAILQHDMVGDPEQKSDRDPPVSNTEDNVEVRRMIDDKDSQMPVRDIDVSESSVLEDREVHSKTDGEVTVDSTNPVAGDVVDVQMEVIAIASGTHLLVPPNDLVVCELQAASEGTYDENVRRKAVIEHIVRDTGCIDTGRVEHHGEGSTASVPSGHDAEDLITNRSPENVPAISDHVMSVEIRPAVNRFNRITGEENTRRNDGFGKKVVPENKGVKTEECRNVDGDLSTMDMALQEAAVSGSPIMGDNEVQRKREGELTVEMVLEQVTSNTDLVTGEAVDVQMDFITIDSESRVPYLAADGLTEAAIVDDIQEITLVEDIVRNTSDPNTLEPVEHLGEEGACSSVSVVSMLTVDDDISSVQAIRDNVTSAERSPDVGRSHETAGVQYVLMNEGFGRKVASVDEDIYTEQLWEELDTIRTVTGYGEVVSSTLEGELTALYIFVGVEPLVSSRDASDLMELSAKLRFLKSIIGME